MCEAWRECFRKGFVPQLSTAGLEALRKALLTDDPRLIQGGTTEPPPLMSVQDWPVEAACATALPFWLGDGINSVTDVEECFAQACFAADKALGEPAGCRHFLVWFDETPRAEMRRELLAEVSAALALRDAEFEAA